MADNVKIGVELEVKEQETFKKSITQLVNDALKSTSLKETFEQAKGQKGNKTEKKNITKASSEFYDTIKNPESTVDQMHDAASKVFSSIRKFIILFSDFDKGMQKDLQNAYKQISKLENHKNKLIGEIQEASKNTVKNQDGSVRYSTSFKNRTIKQANIKNPSREGNIATFDTAEVEYNKLITAGVDKTTKAQRQNNEELQKQYDLYTQLDAIITKYNKNAEEQLNKSLNSKKEQVSSITDEIKTKELDAGAITDTINFPDQVNGSIASDETTKKFQELEKLVESYKERLIQLEQELNKNKDATEKHTKAQEKNTSTVGKAVTTFFGYQMVLRQLRKLWNAAISTIKDLDKALTDQAIVSDLNRQQTWALVDSYQALAKQTGFTTTEIANVATKYFQQGKTVSEVMTLTEAAAKSAKVAGISAANAVDYLTTAINGFQLSAEDALSVSDKFAALAATSATDYEELAVALSKVASQANLAGMSMDYTLGLLAKGIETTREPAESIGTALKTVIARMREISDYGKTLEDGTDINSVEKQLSYINIDLRDASGQLRSTEDVLDDLGRKWDTLNTNQQAAIAKALAGTRQQSRLIAMMTDYERTLELVDESSNSLGATNAQQAEYLESMDAALNNLQVSYQAFITAITDSDIVINIVNWLASIVDWISQLISSTGGMITIIGLLVLALTPFISQKLLDITATLTQIAANRTYLGTLEDNNKGILSNLKTFVSLILGKKTDTVATAASTVATKVNTVAVKNSTKALLANPYIWIALVLIGVVAAIVAVTIAWSNQTSAVDRASKAIQQLTVDIYDIKKSISSINQVTSKYEELNKTLIKTKEVMDEIEENRKASIELIKVYKSNGDLDEDKTKELQEQAQSWSAERVNAYLEKQKQYEIELKKTKDLKIFETVSGKKDTNYLVGKDGKTINADTSDETFAQYLSRRAKEEGKSQITTTGREWNYFKNKIKTEYNSGHKVSATSQIGRGKYYKNTVGGLNDEDKKIYFEDETNKNNYIVAMNDLMDDAFSGLSDEASSAASSITQSFLNNLDSDELVEWSKKYGDAPEEFFNGIATSLKGHEESMITLIDESSSLSDAMDAYNNVVDATIEKYPELAQSLSEQYKGLTELYDKFDKSTIALMDIMGISVNEINTFAEAFSDLTGSALDDLTKKVLTAAESGNIDNLIAKTQKMTATQIMAISALIRNGQSFSDVVAKVTTALSSVENIQSTQAKWEDMSATEKNDFITQNQGLFETDGLWDSSKYENFVNGGNISGMVEDYYESQQKSIGKDLDKQETAVLYEQKMAAKTINDLEKKRVEQNGVLTSEQEAQLENAKSLYNSASATLDVITDTRDELKYIGTIKLSDFVETNNAAISAMRSIIEEELNKTKEAYQDQINELQDGRQQDLEDQKDKLQEEEDNIVDSLNRRKDAYSDYFDSLSKLEDEQTYQEDRDKLIANISKLSGGTDATSQNKVAELKSSLSDLEKERQQTRREEAQQAVLDSIDKNIEDIQDYYDELINKIDDELTAIQDQIEDLNDKIEDVDETIEKTTDAMIQAMLKDQSRAFNYRTTYETQLRNGGNTEQEIMQALIEYDDKMIAAGYYTDIQKESATDYKKRHQHIDPETGETVYYAPNQEPPEGGGGSGGDDEPDPILPVVVGYGGNSQGIIVRLSDGSTWATGSNGWTLQSGLPLANYTQEQLNNAVKLFQTGGKHKVTSASLTADSQQRLTFDSGSEYTRDAETKEWSPTKGPDLGLNNKELQSEFDANYEVPAGSAAGEQISENTGKTAENTNLIATYGSTISTSLAPEGTMDIAMKTIATNTGVDGELNKSLLTSTTSNKEIVQALINLTAAQTGEEGTIPLAIVSLKDQSKELNDSIITSLNIDGVLNQSLVGISDSLIAVNENISSSAASICSAVDRMKINITNNYTANNNTSLTNVLTGAGKTPDVGSGSGGTGTKPTLTKEMW